MPIRNISDFMKRSCIGFFGPCCVVGCDGNEDGLVGDICEEIEDKYR